MHFAQVYVGAPRMLGGSAARGDIWNGLNISKVSFTVICSGVRTSNANVGGRYSAKCRWKFVKYLKSQLCSKHCLVHLQKTRLRGGARSRFKCVKYLKSQLCSKYRLVHLQNTPLRGGVMSRLKFVKYLKSQLCSSYCLVHLQEMPLRVGVRSRLKWVQILKVSSIVFFFLSRFTGEQTFESGKLAL